MATRKQSPQHSNQVLSLRMTADIIKRLDELVERANRSRGVYLRSAITMMLPTLEADHWPKAIAQYESDNLELQFIHIQKAHWGPGVGGSYLRVWSNEMSVQMEP